MKCTIRPKCLMVLSLFTAVDLVLFYSRLRDAIQYFAFSHP